MGLKNNKNIFYYFIGTLVVLLSLIGAWWLTLFFKLASNLEELKSSIIDWNLIKMLKWEGLTFFILLLTLAICLIYVVYLDRRKNKTLQAFYASLTHELKTPLASIKLQSQVMNEIIENITDEKVQIKLLKYSGRLLQDSRTLEMEIDKHLQLSRVEKDAPISLTPVDVENIIADVSKDYPLIEFKSNIDLSVLPIGDHFAINTIIKNIFDNTEKHNKEKIKILHCDILVKGNFVSLDFYDNLKLHQKVELKKLVQLFYKKNSPDGSGIGLYLCSKLAKIQGGTFHISKKDQTLHFEILLPINKEIS